MNRIDSISAGSRREVEEKLIELAAAPDTNTSRLKFEIWFSFIFRTVIQLCTLTSFWLLGFWARKRLDNEWIREPVKRESDGKFMGGGKFVRRKQQ